MRSWGAKLGASRGRQAATPSDAQPSSLQVIPPASGAWPRRATARAPFASRGSGVQIPSAPPVSAGQRPAGCLELFSFANYGEPIAELSAAGSRFLQLEYTPGLPELPGLSPAWATMPPSPRAAVSGGRGPGGRP